MIDDLLIQKHDKIKNYCGRDDLIQNNNHFIRNKKKMIKINKIDEKKIKINTDFLK